MNEVRDSKIIERKFRNSEETLKKMPIFGGVPKEKWTSFKPVRDDFIRRHNEWERKQKEKLVVAESHEEEH